MSFTPARMLPDADAVLIDVLGASGVPVGANVPADLLDRLAAPGGVPYVSAHRFSGASVHPKFLDRAVVVVDSWSLSRRTAAEVAETCRTLLYRAWREQTPHAGATIANFSEVTAPSELRTAGQADGLYRFTATYSLHVRP